MQHLLHNKLVKPGTKKKGVGGGGGGNPDHMLYNCSLNSSTNWSLLKALFRQTYFDIPQGELLMNTGQDFFLYFFFTREKNKFQTCMIGRIDELGLQKKTNSVLCVHRTQQTKIIYCQKQKKKSVVSLHQSRLY